MSKLIYIYILVASSCLLLLAGCGTTVQAPVPVPPVADTVPASAPAPVIAADLSEVPEAEAAGAVFYTANGQPADVVALLASQGINTVRLRIWHSPAQPAAALPAMLAFAHRCQATGLAIWLTVHYSDTWAHPGQQQLPAAWQGLNYQQLHDSLYQYTARLVTTFEPAYIQLGNEINAGWLYPFGVLPQQQGQMAALLGTAAQAVRAHSPPSRPTQIIIHYAGLAGSTEFFNDLSSVDYDVAGLSYYPLWHGKDLGALQQTVATLTQQTGKTVAIAETAYPFTLQWADFTNNIVGLDEQLILPAYPATPQGQLAFTEQVLQYTLQAGGLGVCYWGAAWVAFRGPEATNGSSWENQALFDFNHHLLPAASFGQASQ